MKNKNVNVDDFIILTKDVTCIECILPRGTIGRITDIEKSKYCSSTIYKTLVKIDTKLKSKSFFADQFKVVRTNKSVYALTVT